MATFVQIKNHFKTNRPIETSLFTPSTRSENLQQLYDAAAKTPVNAMEDMDRILGNSDRRSSDIFLCTPVLGQSRKRMKTNCNMDIETGRVSFFILFNKLMHGSLRQCNIINLSHSAIKF